MTTHWPPPPSSTNARGAARGSERATDLGQQRDERRGAGRARARVRGGRYADAREAIAVGHGGGRRERARGAAAGGGGGAAAASADVVGARRELDERAARGPVAEAREDRDVRRRDEHARRLELSLGLDREPRQAARRARAQPAAARERVERVGEREVRAPPPRASSRSSASNASTSSRKSPASKPSCSASARPTRAAPPPPSVRTLTAVGGSRSAARSCLWSWSSTSIAHPSAGSAARSSSKRLSNRWSLVTSRNAPPTGSHSSARRPRARRIDWRVAARPALAEVDPLDAERVGQQAAALRAHVRDDLGAARGDEHDDRAHARRRERAQRVHDHGALAELQQLLRWIGAGTARRRAAVMSATVTGPLYESVRLRPRGEPSRDVRGEVLSTTSPQNSSTSRLSEQPTSEASSDKFKLNTVDGFAWRWSAICATPHGTGDAREPLA